MKTIMFKDKADAIVLPKWPAMVVKGRNVTLEQAAEIIIKTDSHLPDFKYAGNDDALAKKMNELFGIPWESYGGKDFDHNTYWNTKQRLSNKLGCIELAYLTNDRIISSYVGGPHGWCNWQGNIFTNSYNIGKWPEVEEVAQDWGNIAEAFPFLELQCQLFSEEQCSDEPTISLVTFNVKKGHVTVLPTTEQGYDTPVDDFQSNMVSLLSPGREIGIYPDDLEKKLKEVYGEIPQYDDFLVEETA